MKLATRNNNTRDGQLLIVSRDLKRATEAQAATTLQAAVDEWATLSPKLIAEYDALNADDSAGFDFDESACTSPLPRSPQW